MIIIIWLRYWFIAVFLVFNLFRNTTIYILWLSLSCFRRFLLSLCNFLSYGVFSIINFLILSRKSLCFSVTKFIMINLIIERRSIKRWYHTDLFLLHRGMHNVLCTFITVRAHDIHGLSSYRCQHLVVSHVGLVLFNMHAVARVAFEYFYQYDLCLICLWQIRIKTLEINFHIVNFVDQLQVGIKIEQSLYRVMGILELLVLGEIELDGVVWEAERCLLHFEEALEWVDLLLHLRLNYAEPFC